MRARTLVLSSAVLITGCPGDDFECGQELSAGKYTVCDRPSEVCVCDARRCAEEDPDCASGFRFTRGLFGACVDEEAIETRLDQRSLSGPDLLCTATRSECGVENDGGVRTCAAPALCDCRTKTCVTRAPDAGCEFRRQRGEGSAVGDCVDEPPQLLGSGLCPDQRSVDVTCGAPSGAATCSGNELCACDEQAPRCVFADNTCGGKFRYTLDGREGADACLESTPSTLLASGEVCPRFTDPRPQACGEGAACATGDLCACASKTCVRLCPDCAPDGGPTCADNGGSPYVEVSPSGPLGCAEEDDLKLLAGASRCPVEDDVRNPGCRSAADCGAGGLCHCEERRCVTIDRTCVDTGLGYRLTFDGRENAGACLDDADGVVVDDNRLCPDFAPADGGVAEPDAGDAPDAGQDAGLERDR